MKLNKTPYNNHVYGENYHKHSLLIHEQINEIRSILSSTYKVMGLLNEALYKLEMGAS